MINKLLQLLKIKQCYNCRRWEFMPVTVETAAFCKTCINQLLTIALPMETEKLVQQYDELYKKADYIAAGFLRIYEALNETNKPAGFGDTRPPVVN